AAMEISDKIFAIQNEIDYNNCALEIFRFKAKNNVVYQQFLHILKVNPEAIQHYREIPFLPIQFFKSQEVIIEGLEREVTFSASSTTGMITSKQLVAKSDLYVESFRRAFEQFYG